MKLNTLEAGQNQYAVLYFCYLNIMTSDAKYLLSRLNTNQLRV